MKKSDLKSKMCVELREGQRLIVVDDVLLNRHEFNLLIGYNNDLTNKTTNEHDIVKVYKWINNNHHFTNDLGVGNSILNFDFNNNLYFELLWKRNETVELTLDEIANKFGVDVDKLKIKK